MRYAIFDFDGTLIDSMTMWRNMGNIFLETHNYPPLKYKKQMQNDTWEVEFVAAVNEQLGLDITQEYFFERFSEYVKEAYAKHLQLKPTAYDFLDRLYKDGIKMCICSSTHRFMMEPALKRLDLLKFFEFTCHCNDFGKEKNQPDIFIHCMKKLGAEKPCEVAVFEDALYAAKTAAEAGFYTVGISDITEKRADEMQKICNQYINDYTQIDYSALHL
ncbi:MAG: HAD family phosphatase [Oscillospiraceae bacterium]|nr:HAD family phosphatase [Oscillospiraceae bacterium]